MLLRICLIIALLGSLAGGVVNFVYVQKNLKDVISDRDDNKTKKEAALADAAKNLKDLKKTAAELDTTKKTLASTKSQLESANAQVADLNGKVTDLDKRLKETQTSRDDANAKLAQWEQLNLKPQQVLDIIADLKKTKTDRDGVVAENKILNKKAMELADELNQLRNKSDIPLLPTGLRGKVVAVDPKYDFVVLNIGDDKGVVKRGVMMVARDGRLIAKVQISRVDKTECVANLLPGWTRGEVQEGDEVIY